MKELLILGLAYLAYTKFSEGSPASAPVSNTQGQANQIAVGEPNGGGFSAGGVGEPTGSLFDSLLGAGSNILSGSGGSIFDDIFAQARQSAPTYRDEFPVPPGVIHVGPNDYEPAYQGPNEPIFGPGYDPFNPDYNVPIYSNGDWPSFTFSDSFSTDGSYGGSGDPLLTGRSGGLDEWLEDPYGVDPPYFNS